MAAFFFFFNFLWENLNCTKQSQANENSSGLPSIAGWGKTTNKMSQITKCSSLPIPFLVHTSYIRDFLLLTTGLFDWVRKPDTAEGMYKEICYVSSAKTRVNTPNRQTVAKILK